LPMAVLQRTLERIQQVERGLETGAAHAQERLDRARAAQVLAAVQADLSQQGRGLGADVAQAGGHFSDSRNTPATASSPAWSSTSKRPGRGLSRSNTPSSSPSSTSGTTSSAREAESQAMWPGNASTSSTRCVWRLLAAAPQTPRSSGIRTQAGSPWNGPTTSSVPSKK